MRDRGSLDDGSEGAVGTVHCVDVPRDVGQEGTESVLDLATCESGVVLLKQLYKPRILGLLLFNFVCNKDKLLSPTNDAKH